MDSTRTESVRKHEIWVWPIIASLTITAFVVGWVVVTKTLANKDIQIEKIRNSALSQGH